MSEFIENMQHTLKKNSQNIGIFILRLISGMVVGLTLTLIAQEMIGYGQLLFWFIIILTTAVFLKTTKGWKLSGVVALDFVFLLIGLLLKMYILIAPE